MRIMLVNNAIGNMKYINRVAAMSISAAAMMRIKDDHGLNIRMAGRCAASCFNRLSESAEGAFIEEASD